MTVAITFVPILAQRQTESRSILLWSMVLLVLVVCGFLLASWARRQVKAPEQPPSLGFTLADLRQMRQRGQITDEEFERAKTKVLASLKNPPADERVGGEGEPQEGQPPGV